MSDSEDLQKALDAFAGTQDGAPGSCPYPVNEPMIHHWCDAIGDRNPAYLDESAAREAGHEGLIAPPAMLQAWTMRGLRPPTAEEEAHAAAAGDRKSALETLDEAGFTSVVATNCTQRYRRYLRLGDDLSVETTIESISPEKQTALGRGHFVTQRMVYRDQHGELQRGEKR